MQPEMIQKLEERMFLSGSGSEDHVVKTPKSAIVVKKHHVTLRGTRGDDVMSIVASADGLSATVTVNGESKVVSLANLKRFKIMGKAGNDMITVAADVRVMAHGGKGNDTMTAMELATKG